MATEEAMDQGKLESRTEKRFLTRENAIIEIYGKLGRVQAKMKNVSKSGAYLELTQTNLLPKKGDIVHLTIQLYELHRERKLSGEVMWNSGLSLGIMFLAKDRVVSKLMNRWRP